LHGGGGAVEASEELLLCRGIFFDAHSESESPAMLLQGGVEEERARRESAVDVGHYSQDFFAARDFCGCCCCCC